MLTADPTLPSPALNYPRQLWPSEGRTRSHHPSLFPHLPSARPRGYWHTMIIRKMSAIIAINGSDLTIMTEATWALTSSWNPMAETSCSVTWLHLQPCTRCINNGHPAMVIHTKEKQQATFLWFPMTPSRCRPPNAAVCSPRRISRDTSMQGELQNHQVSVHASSGCLKVEDDRLGQARVIWTGLGPHIF